MMPRKRTRPANMGRAVSPHRVRVRRGQDTARAIIKRHFREEGRQMMELVDAWNCTRGHVYDLFCKDRPLAPAHVEGAIRILKLDDFDANELRMVAAREAGWMIDTAYLLHEDKPAAQARPGGAA
ncbi:hypothetical protein [Stenotrophomonas acidaminiphila]|uniref:hypothetical protein n=1 Tax=Stenotrophomonas acidaminiphila TaxID=128780 RepID=UPI001FB03701|nr:hypothetical protein [Stenotrophomonas acidaminiphila]